MNVLPLPDSAGPMCSQHHHAQASNPQFSTSLAQGGGSVRVGARGEIDIANRDALSAAGLRALTLPDAREVVIDLGSVTFLDASGLGSLVSIRNASGVNGKSLLLANIPTRITRLLQLTDLLRHFTVTDLSNDDDLEGATVGEGRT